MTILEIATALKSADFGLKDQEEIKFLNMAASLDGTEFIFSCKVEFSQPWHECHTFVRKPLSTAITTDCSTDDVCERITRQIRALVREERELWAESK